MVSEWGFACLLSVGMMGKRYWGGKGSDADDKESTLEREQEISDGRHERLLNHHQEHQRRSHHPPTLLRKRLARKKAFDEKRSPAYHLLTTYFFYSWKMPTGQPKSH
jgi:hypothetical protein